MEDENWATPSLTEASYWRNGMSPIEYEMEREFFLNNIELWGTPEYMPVWKQLACGKPKSKPAPDPLTAEALIRLLESGSDVLFSYKGKNYIIPSNICMLSERRTEKGAQGFTDSCQLVENGMIEGEIFA